MSGNHFPSNYSIHMLNHSNKLRHRIEAELAEEKRRLFDQIRRYNTLAAEDKIDEALIEGRLAGLGSGPEAQIWPWDANISGSSVSITTKKINTRPADANHAPSGREEHPCCGDGTTLHLAAKLGLGPQDQDFKRG
ncbi:hypothetical protein SKAU_G00094080 [Synaphobranchus kaupii]|uniref:Uncharacterized protein n=1 Tax=Synaphobranchus kaupii TaxID=118154 RepID=A0A9Q1FX94_SYNKA|nr:hypothetical protein SKAU_G00094080 [Synaphobranchus kaupii]